MATGKFQKGIVPWNKGKKGVQASTRKGTKLKPLSEEHKKKIGFAVSKEKHPNWKGGINYNIKYRLSVLEILGFRCCKCGFSDVRALQIDHVNGGGGEERKRKNGQIGNPYKLILNKVLDGSKSYQILCANCNWIKKVENKEVAVKKHTP